MRQRTRPKTKGVVWVCGRRPGGARSGFRSTGVVLELGKAPTQRATREGHSARASPCIRRGPRQNRRGPASAGCVPLRCDPDRLPRLGLVKVPWSIDRRPSGAPFAYNLIANPGFEADDIRLSKPEASRGYEQRVDIKEWQCQGAITSCSRRTCTGRRPTSGRFAQELSAGYSGYAPCRVAGVLVWNDRTLYTYDAGKYPAELRGDLIAGPRRRSENGSGGSRRYGPRSTCSSG